MIRVSSCDVLLGIDDIAHLGPGAIERVQTATRPTWITYAIAYCYEDWQAQQRMDDDGMRHPLGCA
jgi:hypothetical protein